MVAYIEGHLDFITYKEIFIDFWLVFTRLTEKRVFVQAIFEARFEFNGAVSLWKDIKNGNIVTLFTKLKGIITRNKLIKLERNNAILD